MNCIYIKKFKKITISANLIKNKSIKVDLIVGTYEMLITTMYYVYKPYHFERDVSLK